ncbi:MAG: UDP-N-acetylmuramoylalanine--D-glutamate ligase [Armatimonadetes bacterium 55-13]|nr:UDP-N-acetylmuramoyl-L-alanine--D-glutamate ligase [Armatimonadota bacterium]OJU64802.1 MAG: UDP-N-acetylmuramoylalanine--D-glutamate ligase [Armatimonadetes bacterium 55-13]
MKNSRIAVFGLGRSGLAIARGALAQGAHPHVFDQANADSLLKPEILEEARTEGITVTLGWDGKLPEGLDLLVVNPAVDMRSAILREAVEAGIEVISEVEFAFRISKAPIIAITGTNGKSTTTVMTYICLKACGIDAVLCGNIFGSGYPEVPMTEAALRSTPDQILVAEISSFQLEWVREFKPVSAGITNIWPDHLDRYDSFEQYAATKQRIFNAQDENDFAVVKAHDPVVKAPGQSAAVRRGRRPAPELIGVKTPTVLTFGATGEHARVDERFLTVLDKQVKIEELTYSEPHNYTNACMAGLLAFGALKASSRIHPEGVAAKVVAEAEKEAEASRAARRTAYNERQLEANKPQWILPAAILEGLRSFTGIAHRMEFVGERDGIRVINNSMCTNPDAVLKSAMALRGPNHILIGGRNKDLDFRPLRNYFANGMHHAYLYGEARQSLTEQIGHFPTFERMEDAFAAAVDAARSGEVVMLAPGCASSDQFRDFRHRGDVFKQIAKEWLEQ